MTWALEEAARGWELGKLGSDLIYFEAIVPCDCLYSVNVSSFSG